MMVFFLSKTTIPVTMLVSESADQLLALDQNTLTPSHGVGTSTKNYTRFFHVLLSSGTGFVNHDTKDTQPDARYLLLLRSADACVVNSKHYYVPKMTSLLAQSRIKAARVTLFLSHPTASAFYLRSK